MAKKGFVPKSNYQDTRKAQWNYQELKNCEYEYLVETIRHAMFSSETIFPLVIQRVAFLTCQEQGYSKESFVTLSSAIRLLRNGPQEMEFPPRSFPAGRRKWPELWCQPEKLLCQRKRFCFSDNLPNTLSSRMLQPSQKWASDGWDFILPVLLSFACILPSI